MRGIYQPLYEKEFNGSEAFVNASRGEGAKVAVIVGDSTMTEEPTISFDKSRTIAGAIEKRLIEDNPETSWTIYHRAIGGTRTEHLSENRYADFQALIDVNITVPSWATPLTDSWFDHIVGLDPDILFIGFGMNDKYLLLTSTVQDIVNTISARLPNTDIVIVTNMVPNYYGSTVGVAGSVEQNGRLMPQHYWRTVAKYLDGWSVLDLGRAQTKAVAGFDPVFTYMNRDQNSVSSSLPFTFANSTDQDFGFTMSIDLSAALATSRMKVLTSFQGQFDGSWVEIYDNSGNIAVEFADLDNVQGRYLTVTSTVATPVSGTNVLGVWVRDNWCRIVVDNAEVFNGKIKRHGGSFKPQISMLDASTPGITITTYKATFLDNRPTLSYTQMFGTEDTSNNITGGNYLNHPTDEGFAKVVHPYLQTQNFALDKDRINQGILYSGGIAPVINNNTTYTLPTPQDSGILFMWCNRPNVGAMVGFNSSSSPIVLWSQTGAITTIATAGTDLTGTTGVGGEFTLSVKDGEIELENRTGNNISSLRYMFLASES